MNPLDPMAGLVKNKKASAKPPGAYHLGRRWGNQSGRSKSRGRLFLVAPQLFAQSRLGTSAPSSVFHISRVLKGKEAGWNQSREESGRARTTQRAVPSAKHTWRLLATVYASRRPVLSNGSAPITTPGWRKATLLRQDGMFPQLLERRRTILRCPRPSYFRTFWPIEERRTPCRSRFPDSTRGPVIGWSVPC